LTINSVLLTSLNNTPKTINNLSNLTFQFLTLMINNSMLLVFQTTLVNRTRIGISRILINNSSVHHRMTSLSPNSLHCFKVNSRNSPHSSKIKTRNSRHSFRTNSKIHLAIFNSKLNKRCLYWKRKGMCFE